MLLYTVGIVNPICRTRHSSIGLLLEVTWVDNPTLIRDSRSAPPASIHDIAVVDAIAACCIVVAAARAGRCSSSNSSRVVVAKEEWKSKTRRKSKTKSIQSRPALNGLIHTRLSRKNTGRNPYGLPSSVNLQLALCNNTSYLCFFSANVPTHMSATRCRTMSNTRSSFDVLRPDANNSVRRTCSLQRTS